MDDQSLYREGVNMLLSAHADFLIVGEASNGAEAIQQTQDLSPDIVLMDIRMPQVDGVAATRQIRQRFPRTHVIMLTTFDDNEYVFEGLRAGAVGYLLKDTPSKQLAEAIRATMRGESFLQPSVAAKVVAEFSRLTPINPSESAADLVEPLSERETEILRSLCNGSSNKEIATALYITEGTVKNHVTNILGKLGVRDRTQAALRAKELKLI